MNQEAHGVIRHLTSSVRIIECAAHGGRASVGETSNENKNHDCVMGNVCTHGECVRHEHYGTDE